MFFYLCKMYHNGGQLVYESIIIGKKKLIYIQIIHTIERYQIRLIGRGGEIITEAIELGSKSLV